MIFMEILFYQNLSSTNLEAKKMVKKRFLPWTVIWANSQSKGYGKEKRFWFSPPGGLYFSIILPKISLSNLQILTLASGIAVIKVFARFKIKANLKWPNDIMIFEKKSKKFKKIGGILVENVIGKDLKISVVGIGLNTNIKKFPKGLQESATSLQIELKKKVDNERILKSILKELKKILKMNNGKIMVEYKNCQNTLGKKIKIFTKDKIFLGTAFNFDRRGYLLVKLEKGQVVKILEGDLNYEFQRRN